MKRVLKWLGILVALALLIGGGYVLSQVMAFDSSMAKKYEIAMPKIERSTDANVIARGKHLAESMAGCAISDCHGSDLSGGKVMEIGPVATMVAPNLTSAGIGGKYSDGEIARLMLHGVKRDGTSVAMMPVNEFNWLPDDDIQAVISYVRSVPPVQKPDQFFHAKPFGKVLDRQNKFPIDIARRIDHDKRAIAPAPEPTEKYGRYLGQMCMGCHGATLSGGPIPGAPPDLPIPPNITPHESGIKAYAYEDFIKLLETGIRKNGNKLNPFMPYEALSHMNDIERKALWAFLQTVEPRPFGGR